VVSVVLNSCPCFFPTAKRRVLLQVREKVEKCDGVRNASFRPLLFAALTPAPEGDFKMSVQKSHSAPPNKVHLHANKLYRLMTEVGALRDRVRSLEVRVEAKPLATNPIRTRVEK
jgi:hypothetical protein